MRPLGPRSDSVLREPELGSEPALGRGRGRDRDRDRGLLQCKRCEVAYEGCVKSVPAHGNPSA